MDKQQNQDELKDCAEGVSRGVKKALSASERTYRLAKELETVIKKAEAAMHATEATLHQTEKRADRLHRNLRQRRGRG